MGDHYGRHDIEADRRAEASKTPEQRAYERSQNELISRLTKERDEAYRLVKEAKEALTKAGTVLQPLLDIADAYEASNLDEHRPDWRPVAPGTVELFTGRGGKRLLTLEDCLQARTFVKGT